MSRRSKEAIEVHAMFATPVVTIEIAESERLNAALRRSILERAERHPSTRHSNLGGWQSTWDLEQWGGQAAGRLLDQARAAADRLTADRDGRPAKVAWQSNAWANVNRRGHGNEFHTHPGSFWSGAYYIDDGGAAADPALGGEFEFQDPRGVAPAMYAPQLCINLPGGRSMGASETITPRVGLMLLFPAWLSHAVRPYLGPGQRISVAFNLSV